MNKERQHHKARPERFEVRVDAHKKAKLEAIQLIENKTLNKIVNEFIDRGLIESHNPRRVKPQ